MMQCRYISLVNLLADKELFPEYLSSRCEAPAVAGHVIGWLNDDASYRRLCGELAQLRDKIAQPGACTRAARRVLEFLQARRESQAA
jgi:lipid-A-disaccharide synthase